MSELNCQPDDIKTDPPFTLLSEDSVAAASAPFPAQMTNYHRAALAEYQITYTDALCTLRIYQDEDTAVYALQQLCQAGTGDPTTTSYGEESCGFRNEGVVDLHFRQDEAVVTIREDGGGTHIGTWAEAVIGRLTD